MRGSRSDLTAEQFVSLATRVYGRKWRARLREELRCARYSVTRWSTGLNAVPYYVQLVLLTHIKAKKLAQVAKLLNLDTDGFAKAKPKKGRGRKAVGLVDLIWQEAMGEKPTAVRRQRDLNKAQEYEEELRERRENRKSNNPLASGENEA